MVYSCTYAAKGENSIFVELLRWAAHLHGAVAVLLHQNRLSLVRSIPFRLLNGVPLNLLLPAAQVNWKIHKRMKFGVCSSAVYHLNLPLR